MWRRCVIGYKWEVKGLSTIPTSTEIYWSSRLKTDYFYCFDVLVVTHLCVSFNWHLILPFDFYTFFLNSIQLQLMHSLCYLFYNCFNFTCKLKVGEQLNILCKNPELAYKFFYLANHPFRTHHVCEFILQQDCNWLSTVFCLNMKYYKFIMIVYL